MISERPWRHPVAWSGVPAAGVDMVLRPKGNDLSVLAQEVGAEAVKSLEAQLQIRRWLDGLEITGRIEAVVTRICGVSLDPFDELIHEPIALRIVPAGSPNAATGVGNELILDPDESDPPDTVAGEVIDLAAVVTEQLALALDPFPRKPGAVFEAVIEEPPPSPFAALARLKNDPGES